MCSLWSQGPWTWKVSCLLCSLCCHTTCLCSWSWFDCHYRISLVPSAQSTDLELASLHVSRSFSKFLTDYFWTWSRTQLLYGSTHVCEWLVCNPCFFGFFQAMCGLLHCGPVFDPNGLITGGYLYNWLQTVLNSPKEKVRLGASRVSLLRQHCALHCVTLVFFFLRSISWVTIHLYICWRAMPTSRPYSTG